MNEPHSLREFDRERDPRQQIDDAGYNYFEFLAEATDVLASALDFTVALATVARLALPRIADYALVHLVENDGTIRQVAAAHRDRRKERLLTDLDALYRDRPGARGNRVADVIAGGEPFFGTEIGVRRPGGHDPAIAKILSQLAPLSSMIVPLVARGRTLGAISFVTAESGRRYGREDLILALEIARYAGLAIDNARLYTEAQREIGERRVVEHALRAGESRLRSLVDSNIIGVVFTRLDGTILDANDAFLRIVGRGRENLGSIRLEEMTPPDFREIDRLAAEEMKIRGARTPYEKEFVHADGTNVPVLIAGALLDGADDESVGFVLDLTERKRAERALEEKNRELETIFESMTDAFLALDGEWRLTYVNGEAERLLGRERCDLLGRDVREAFPEATGAVFFRRYREAIENRRTTEFVELYEPVGKWIETRVFPSERGLAIYMHDVTDRVLAEEELKRAKETAEAASMAKDRFLAVLSHELRTPLTPALAMIDGLLADPSLGEETRASVELIGRNVEMEARLIDDLLDLNRIAKGKLTLDTGVVDLHALIDEVMGMYAAELVAKELNAVTDLRACCPTVHGDAARLRQILWNIVRNAVKFTATGGSVTIRTCDADDSRICVEISDSGIGIEPELMPHIFNAFEQGAAAITRTFGGLGLGLAITKALVELHGGTIAARSDGKERGATFRLEFPVEPIGIAAAKPVESTESRESSPAEPVSLVANEKTTRKTTRILLVEDHADTCNVIRLLLERSGFVVELARDLRSALEAARRARFDLLISDIGLPDGSGIDLITNLRAAGHTIPAIALSGFGMEEDTTRSHAAGFAEHLVKPVSVKRLIDVIRGLV